MAYQKLMMKFDGRWGSSVQMYGEVVTRSKSRSYPQSALIIVFIYQRYRSGQIETISATWKQEQDQLSPLGPPSSLYSIFHRSLLLHFLSSSVQAPIYLVIPFFPNVALYLSLLLQGSRILFIPSGHLLQTHFIRNAETLIYVCPASLYYLYK